MAWVNLPNTEAAPRRDISRRPKLLMNLFIRPRVTEGALPNDFKAALTTCSDFIHISGMPDGPSTHPSSWRGCPLDRALAR